MVFGSSYTIDLQDIDKTKLALVGSKAANLGELGRIRGISVPDGFCINTEAYRKIIGENSSIKNLINELDQLRIEDHIKIRDLSAEIRQHIEELIIPAEIQKEIIQFLSILGERYAYAVRSSATAEDLPTASFAGQQDTYVNIIGQEEILKHISKCWSSLFTERAVTYRMLNRFDHDHIQLAVLVQKMIFPQVAGILFTADPVNSNRKILSIDASFGLGEALVSGLVNADNYKVREGRIINKKISSKNLAIYGLPGGGTKEEELKAEVQTKQALPDEQILELERMGRMIEARFGRPQDIEWCLADDRFYFVQSRPITTLFPIPKSSDNKNHLYVSVGHQQMMTDAMRPLGLSMWQLTAARPMSTAGGRLFVDVADDLATPGKREIITDVLGKNDPLIKDAILTILERGDFIKPLPPENGEQPGKNIQGRTAADFRTLKEYDPAVVDELIRNSHASTIKLHDEIRVKSGPGLLDFIEEDTRQFKKAISDPKSFGVIMTAMNASAWINEKMEDWLGEKNAADILSQSVPNNITSQMGLDLLDVADIIRPYPKIIAFLNHVKDDHFLEDLVQFDGGQKIRHTILNYLKKYGMRCAGEIDMTNPRWSEKPGMLVPIILSHIRNFEPGASSRKFEQGQQEALKKEQDILDRLNQLPDGEQKAEQTKRMISLVRNLIGYREYPKYAIVNRYFIYKQALLKEARRLVEAGVLREQEDIFYLSFEELREIQFTHELNHDIIATRKDEFRHFEKLTPPRVITSEGEIITGHYKRENLPDGALVGLAVSSGLAEGRARVILTLEDAALEDGDILVTAFTDPSWTPLFVSIKGLVTEVGGLMTHGAVIAREFGLPAVVGVESVTKLIKDGQRIRVNGIEGYVEIL